MSGSLSIGRESILDCPDEMPLTTGLPVQQERRSLPAKPLVIDLYCGLVDPELLFSANTPIQKFVARRTQKPNHMPLRIGYDFPSAVSFELRPMGDFQNAVLAARLTRYWKVGASPAKATDNGVFKRSSGIVDFLNTRPLTMKSPALGSCGFPGAVRRAVSAIRARWCDVEMCSASNAVPASKRDICLLKSPYTSSLGLTRKRTISLVGPLGGKFCGTLYAKQFIHRMFIS